METCVLKSDNVVEEAELVEAEKASEEMSPETSVETEKIAGSEGKDQGDGVELNSDLNSKLGTLKRKRSVDNSSSVQERNAQRRSTRSHAYAQRIEEDIDSLRAELRSFLPTTLL